MLWRVPGAPAADAATEFVDLQRDATVADIARAVGAGLTSIEHIKRYTTIGTAHDQGKTSGVIATGITAELLGVPVADTGTTTFRPPYTPVAFAALAGRDRGRMFDPERLTALHDWHVRAGAVFEDVGQWKRPRYYPQPGEDMDTAVLRECAATRTGVGILDGSTLGKIDVQGPDAGSVPRPDLHQPDEQPEGRLRAVRRDVRRRRHGHRRRHRAPAGRRPVPGADHHRRRRQNPGLDGGMAADRVAAPAGVLHLGHRAVGHLPGGRTPLPRRDRRRLR